MTISFNRGWNKYPGNYLCCAGNCPTLSHGLIQLNITILILVGVNALTCVIFVNNTVAM